MSLADDDGTQEQGQLDVVNIQPTTAVLGVFRHINYKPWFALAEFVDNAIQSYQQNRWRLEAAHAGGYRLRISIERDEDARQLVIRDNAAGIAHTDFQRALRPGALPLDRSGLSEFGMGLKNAACWFCNQWTLQSTALGEDVQRTVVVDVPEIVQQEPEELPIEIAASPAAEHWTVLTLNQVEKMPRGNTTKKIREHLASIYREFLRAGILELMVFGQPVEFPEAEILNAPWHREPEGPSREWKQQLDFNIGGVSIWGFAALLKTGSTTDAGFGIFRRNRLILGSRGEGYRPSDIFGKSTTFLYQRLFGELHMEGMAVTHTKDGLGWDGDGEEEAFVKELLGQLTTGPGSLLDQGRNYRSSKSGPDVLSSVDRVATQTTDEFAGRLGPALDAIEATPTRLTSFQLQPLEVGEAATVTAREHVLERADSRVTVRVEIVTSERTLPWCDVGYEVPSVSEGRRQLSITARLSLTHPFIQRFLEVDGSTLDPLVRVVASMAVAEADAVLRALPVQAVRESMDLILRDVFSQAQRVVG